MRILMLAQFYAPVIGGEERMVEALSVGLARRGHEVSVATLAQEGLPPSEWRDGVRIHRVHSAAQRLTRAYSEPGRRQAVPAPDPITVRGLRAVLANERPEVVHAHNWLVHSLVPLKRRSGAALVLSLHDMSFVCATKRFVHEGAPCSGPALAKCVVNASRHYGAVKGLPVALAVRGMQPALRRAVDLFLPVSRAVADGCGLQASGLPYEVAPNFLDDAPVEDAPPVGLPEDGFLLFVGDLVEEKGIHVLLDAYGGLDAAPPLVLIRRPYSARLRALPANVLMLGPRPHAEVLAAWRRCSVAIVPSTWPEPFGLVALEAQAAGKPVVASRVGGLGDIVVDDETGVLVPPGDAEALGRALRRLLLDPDERDRMGASARRHAACFAASPALRRMEALYARARAQRGR